MFDLRLCRSLRELTERTALRPGALLAANCDTFAWSRPCIGWKLSSPPENYSAWFARGEHGMSAADWTSISAAMAASSLPPPAPEHAVWNFGCTLLELSAHRQLHLAQSFEALASRLLETALMRPDTLLYGPDDLDRT